MKNYLFYSLKTIFFSSIVYILGCAVNTDTNLDQFFLDKWKTDISFNKIATSKYIGSKENAKHRKEIIGILDSITLINKVKIDSIIIINWVTNPNRHNNQLGVMHVFDVKINDRIMYRVEIGKTTLIKNLKEKQYFSTFCQNAENSKSIKEFGYYKYYFNQSEIDLREIFIYSEQKTSEMTHYRLDDDVEKVVQYTNIEDALLNLHDVKYLNLSNQNLFVFPEKILLFSDLEVLELTNNEISKIPSDIRKLKNLKYLDLSNNYIEVLPYEIGLLDALKVFSIMNNKIKKIPSSFCSSLSLEKIVLHGNTLSEIPNCITQIPNLYYIGLGSSKPDSILLQSFAKNLPDCIVSY